MATMYKDPNAPASTEKKATTGMESGVWHRAPVNLNENQKSQQAQGTSAAQGPDPFTAMGGGVWTGEGWVPKDHPMAGGAAAPPPAPPAGGAMPPSPPAGTQAGVPVAGGTPGAVSAPPLVDSTQQSAGAPPTSPNPFASHPAGGVWIPGSQQWVPGDHPLAQSPGAMPGGVPPPGGPAPPPGQPGAPGDTPPPAGTPPPPGTLETPPPAIEIDEAVDPADEAFKAALLELLGQDPNDVSLTDADVAPQQRAFQAAQERAALQQRAELMERASAEGIADSEATRAAGRAIQERTGQAIGQHDADLLTQKMEARREQLNQAMQIANARGMQQEANDLARQIANLDAQLKTSEQGLTREGMQLQRDLATLDANTKTALSELDAKLRREGYSTQERLAQLDAEVRRYGIDTQGNIGQLELALRRELGIGELNLGLLQTLLQNEQFGNKLGFDIGAFQAGLNKDALLAAL